MTNEANTPTLTTPLEIAELYLDCWERKDFEPLRPYLAETISFDGPLGSTRGIEDALAGLNGLAAGTTTVLARKRLADETDVLTWFDLTLGAAPTTAVVNWTHVEDGRITAVRAAFDPRAILAAG